jgi:hypothetical protein
MRSFCFRSSALDGCNFYLHHIFIYAYEDMLMWPVLVHTFLHNQVDTLVLQSKSFAHRALSHGDTGPALESGLAIQEFVIAFFCRFQVILLHGYINFPMINDLRQILLNRYMRIGLESGGPDPLPPDHLYQTVKEGSSWEGSGPIQLPYIPQDSTRMVWQ